MATTTIDVLSLSEATALESGDTLLLIHPNTDGTQTAMRIDSARFKGEQGEKGADGANGKDGTNGKDGAAYNVDNITASLRRNRLSITV